MAPKADKADKERKSRTDMPKAVQLQLADYVERTVVLDATQVVASAGPPTCFSDAWLPNGCFFWLCSHSRVSVGCVFFLTVAGLLIVPVVHSTRVHAFRNGRHRRATTCGQGHCAGPGTLL